MGQKYHSITTRADPPGWAGRGPESSLHNLSLQPTRCKVPCFFSPRTLHMITKKVKRYSVNVSFTGKNILWKPITQMMLFWPHFCKVLKCLEACIYVPPIFQLFVYNFKKIYTFGFTNVGSKVNHFLSYKLFENGTWSPLWYLYQDWGDETWN